MSKVFYVIGDDSFCELQDSLEFVGDISSNYADAIGTVIEVHKRQNETHDSFIFGSSLLENIRDAAIDNYSELAEEYLSDLINNQEKCKELEKLIGDWLGKNTEQPTFYQSGGQVDEIIVDKDLLDKHCIDLS